MMDDADIFEESRSLRAALRSGLKRASAVTACSAFTLADAQARFGLEPGRGMVIPNGVSLDAASSAQGTGGSEGARSRWTPVPGDPDRNYLLALGRVVEKKGFDLLLAAYAGVASDHPGCDLAIAGEGAALDRLQRLAGELGIDDRVHFVGRLSRQDVAAAMDGATAFVMPSRLEPFGIVILEAWRAGVAVVASTRGGAPEFVDDGVTGVLVDPFDTGAFTSALDRLLTDSPSREAIAAEGHARVRAFDWRVVTEQYRAVYRSVTSQPSAAGRIDIPAVDGDARFEERVR